MKIENSSSAAQSYVPVTFGHVFAQGHLTSSESVTGKLSDGKIVPLQLDVKAIHPDGSVRHGLISAVLPSLAANQIQPITLAKATAQAQSGSGPASLINSGFTANVTIRLAGQLYTASADELLKTGKYTTWLSGPIANEWHVSAPLKTAGGAVHPHLTARFAVRSYGSYNKARVDVTIENNWAYEPSPQNFTYDADVVVGGQTVYSKASLKHYHHARWRKTFWWGTSPQVHVRHNTSYLISTKAVPNYDQTVQVSSSAIAYLKSKFATQSEPMSSGLAVPYMPTTGGRGDIGLLPSWAAMYLLSMDPDAKAITLGTADLAGSWSSHYRDKNTDRPVSLVNYPYMSVIAPQGDTFNPATNKYESFPTCGGACDTPNVADSAHEPSFAYLPYLVTGDYYYLEELQFWAMWNMFQHNPAYRDNVKGLFKPDQVRGQAWSLRTLSEAAYITPDSHPLKAQLSNFLSNNLDWYNATYSNNPNADNSLGIITNIAMVYDGGIGIAPWQDDFFTSAVGHTVELGYAKAKPLLAWKAKFPISRMVGPGYCWIVGATYSLKVRDSASSPIYSSIGQTYTATFPSTFTSLQCASQAMATNLGLKVGEMTGYSSANDGLPSNMQPAIAYSADSGAGNGANAWQKFAARFVKPDYSTSPQFAIVPRQ